MTGRAALVIVGMHRSGTSALARMLSLLGAGLPRNLNPAGPGNETGHWEPEAAVRLNDAILELAGTSVNDVHGPDGEWLQQPAALAFVDRLAALIADEYGDELLLVLKDPRIALLFPLWRAALARLDIRCAALVITRNPVEVAQSLTTRQGLTGDWQRWPPERGGLLWLRYNLAAEAHTRDVDRAFCNYASLLDDWRSVARQLGETLGVTWPRPIADAAAEIDGFLSPKLRHHREPDALAGRGGIWSSWIAPVFAELRDAEGGRAPDPAVLAAVGRSFDAIHACLEPGETSPEPAGDATPERPALELSMARAMIAASRNALTGEVGRYVRSLEAALAERAKEAADAARYARSLEGTLAEMRTASETAAAYARSLEQSQQDAASSGEIDRYVESLQAALEERAREAETAARYAGSLEATLAELRRENETAADYARSLERSRNEIEQAAERDRRAGEAERYVESLQAALAQRSTEAEQAALYAHSLEETLAALRRENEAAAAGDALGEIGRYVESLQAALAERSDEAGEAARYARSLEDMLAQARQESETAAGYAQGLEGELRETSRYARSLEATIEARAREAGEAARYAGTLEATLAALRRENEAAADYAASLEQARAGLEDYARALEAEREKATAAAEQ